MNKTNKQTKQVKRMIEMNSTQYYEKYLKDLMYDAKMNQVELNMQAYVDGFPRGVVDTHIFCHILYDMDMSEEIGILVMQLHRKFKYANENNDLDNEEHLTRLEGAYQSVEAFIRYLAQHLVNMKMSYEELAHQYDDEDISVFDTNEAFVMWYYDEDGLGYQKGVQDALKFKSRQDWINSIKNDNTFELDDGRIAVVMGL